MTIQSAPEQRRADGDEPVVPEPHDELPDHLDRGSRSPRPTHSSRRSRSR
ncbi:MAG: hypothetical protein R2697_13655 [Ilumatobacteraceae bacterium]